MIPCALPGSDKRVLGVATITNLKELPQVRMQQTMLVCDRVPCDREWFLATALCVCTRTC